MLDELQELYTKFPPNKWSWIVSWSGGKDSSFLLLKTIEFAEAMGFEIKVVHHDSMVEYPQSYQVVDSGIEWLKSKRIKVILTRPEEGFFTCMIRRGYHFPKWNAIWCTSLLKLKPVTKLFLNLSLKENILNLIAIRGDEVLRQRDFLQEETTRYVMKGVMNVQVTSPLARTNIKQVWDGLMSYSNIPWVKKLLKLYPFPHSRTGCWTCTVAKEKTLQFLDYELYEIKLQLVEARCKSTREFVELVKYYAKKRPDAFREDLSWLDPNANYPEVDCWKKCEKCYYTLWRKTAKKVKNWIKVCLV